MNKSEIIKLAFEKSSDAKEALAIAREIEALVLVFGSGVFLQWIEGPPAQVEKWQK